MSTVFALKDVIMVKMIKNNTEYNIYLYKNYNVYLLAVGTMTGFGINA